MFMRYATFDFLYIYFIAAIDAMGDAQLPCHAHCA